MPRFAVLAVTLCLILPTAAPSDAWADPGLADAGKGQQVFQRCAACHSISSGTGSLPGPNLRGVVGRRAGTLPGFEYSSAMVDAGKTDNVVWTPEMLDKYLTDPDDVVPGTAMRLDFQLTPSDRRDVIEYLEQAGKN